MSAPLVALLCLALGAPALAQRGNDEDAPPPAKPEAAPEKKPRAQLEVSGAPGLVEKLGGILRNNEALEGARISVVVERLDRRKKRRLFAANPDLALHPASNTKVVTTAAALSLLGPAHTWSTDLATPKEEALPADAKAGAVGTLYLIGRGDPRFVNESLWYLTERARQHGLTEVTGDLVVDDTRFTPDRLAPGFDQKDMDDSYRAASGAMSLNFNSTIIEVRPGDAAGDAPKVTLRPDSGYAVVENTATTTSKGRTAITVKSVPYKDRTLIKVSGRLSVKSKGATVRKRIDNPALFAGYAAKLFLERAGIPVRGKVRVAKAPKKRRLIARTGSRTLALAAVDINKLSNNFMAEQVLRTIGVRKGAKGDWASGAHVVRKFLQKEVGLKGEFKYINGSGLFGETAFSAQQMVDILRHMHTASPPMPEFAASLAVNGQDGTLRRRLKELPRGTVRAKTGTLDGVVCLSGYITFANGKLGAFSILLNDLKGATWQAWKVQDAILLALARYKP